MMDIVRGCRNLIFFFFLFLYGDSSKNELKPLIPLRDTSPFDPVAVCGPEAGGRIRDGPSSVLPSDDRYQPALAAAPVKLGLDPTSRQVSLTAPHSEPDSSGERSW